MTFQHGMRDVQATLRAGEPDDLVGTRRVPVPGARAQPLQVPQGGTLHDQVSGLTLGKINGDAIY